VPETSVLSRQLREFSSGAGRYSARTSEICLTAAQLTGESLEFFRAFADFCFPAAELPREGAISDRVNDHSYECATGESLIHAAAERHPFAPRAVLAARPMRVRRCSRCSLAEPGCLPPLRGLTSVGHAFLRHASAVAQRIFLVGFHEARRQPLARGMPLPPILRRLSHRTQCASPDTRRPIARRTAATSTCLATTMRVWQPLSVSMCHVDVHGSHLRCTAVTWPCRFWRPAVLRAREPIRAPD
jgi:hypothetical protein